MERPKTVIEFHTGFQPTERTSTKGEELHIYDCPFCGKDQHLYYFPETTTWDCKVCNAHGNMYSFIQQFYNDCCKTDVKELAKSFQLPYRVFEQVKYNPFNDTYVLPTFRNGKVNNLYKYVGHTNRFYGTPKIPTTLMDWNDGGHKDVWICEGQKDKLAGDAIIGTGREIEAIGIPGANTFREAWANAFNDKRVLLVFDNDEAGKKGKEKVIEIFKNSPSKPESIHEVVWPTSKPTGYDLRDHYLEHKGLAYKELIQLSEPINIPEGVKVKTESIIADIGCDSYSKALDYYAEAYHTTADTKTALAMIMASIYSLNIDGEQLWLKIIGSPGCGKSTIAKAISASDHVVSLSTFTGLFSGFRDGEEGDPGMVPLISGRTLVVKDADALLRQGNIEKIMSELRDFFDKTSSVRYGNRQAYHYEDVRSTFIMMGTQVLRRQDQSFLGERLLSLEIDISKDDKEAIKRKKMKHSLAVALGSKDNPEKRIMAGFKGWLDHLRDTPLDSTIPESYQEELLRLASVTALLRTQVDRDFRGKLQSPAVPELPTRLIGQCVTATLALCAVYGINNPSEDVHRIIKKMLRDTTNPRSHRYVICDVILDNPGIIGTEIAEATGLNPKLVYEELMDLLELQFIKTRSVEAKSRPGFSTKGFLLSEEIKSSFKEMSS